MPELPDVTVYVERLGAHFRGRTLDSIRIVNPFVLRTVEPDVDSVAGTELQEVRRIGKRIALGFAADRWVVIHLMIAGRLREYPSTRGFSRRNTLAVLRFGERAIHFTEAGSKRRASIHMVDGEAGLAQFDRGGLDVFATPPDGLVARLRSENHTLKRALTDPRIWDGIGNAYSDEILHEAQVSPLLLTSRLDDTTGARLVAAARTVLARYTERIRREVGAGFPDTVTAFRSDMAVHGKYGQPCPRCGSPVQRIRYAENETNYCPTCQTGGTLLADRALSRLLKTDWPRSLDELEELRRRDGRAAAPES